MAAIDYGAIWRKNGVFMNANTDLFSGPPEFVQDKAEQDGKMVHIAGNYYIYVGDADCFIAFYKGEYVVVANGKVTFADFHMPFLSKTYLNPAPNIAELKVSHLDKEPVVDNWYKVEPWQEHVRDVYSGATGCEPLNELEKGRKEYQCHLRKCRRAARIKAQGKQDKYLTNRWLAEWEYKGDKYEVIFGYGIDPQESVWREICEESYGFTPKEVEIIDSWFAGPHGFDGR